MFITELAAAPDAFRTAQGSTVVLVPPEEAAATAGGRPRVLLLLALLPVVAAVVASIGTVSTGTSSISSRSTMT